MKHISVQSFREAIAAEVNNPTVDFINVCLPAEFKEKHIAGVRNVPLGEITQHLNEFSEKQTIYVHCRSGKRSAAAIEQLVRAGVTAELVNVEGGMTAWDEAGYALRSQTNRLPIMRQVLLTAGSLVTSSVFLGFLVDPNFYFLAAGVGIGLTFAGATGWCGMSYVLARMPWNK